VRSLHRHAPTLPRITLLEMRGFARTAGTLSRPEIERQYYKYERIAKYANFS
jgi:hypothetical protein